MKKEQQHLSSSTAHQNVGNRQSTDGTTIRRACDKKVSYHERFELAITYIGHFRQQPNQMNKNTSENTDNSEVIKRI